MKKSKLKKIECDCVCDGDVQPLLSELIDGYNEMVDILEEQKEINNMFIEKFIKLNEGDIEIINLVKSTVELISIKRNNTNHN